MSKTSEYDVLKSAIYSVNKLSSYEIKFLISELERVIKHKSIKLEGYKIALKEATRRERRGRIKKESKTR